MPQGVRGEGEREGRKGKIAKRMPRDDRHCIPPGIKDKSKRTLLVHKTVCSTAAVKVRLVFARLPRSQSRLPSLRAVSSEHWRPETPQNPPPPGPGTLECQDQDTGENEDQDTGENAEKDTAGLAAKEHQETTDRTQSGSPETAHTGW
eukprot:186572-Rhodomonas_salina.1